MSSSFCTTSQGRVSINTKSTKAHKKKPFTISRQPRKLPSSNDSMFGLLESETRALVPIARKDPQLELQNQILSYLPLIFHFLIVF